MNRGTIAIRLDPETRSKLELLSRATGHSRSFIVAEAVRMVVEAEYAALLARSAPSGQKERTDDESDVMPERWNLIV